MNRILSYDVGQCPVCLEDPAYLVNLNNSLRCIECHGYEVVTIYLDDQRIGVATQGSIWAEVPRTEPSEELYGWLKG
jgi:hypothetical protein